MQRARRDPILIQNKAAHNDSQPLDIEMGILDLEGIEGPFDQRDFAREGVLALLELQQAADARVAVLFQDPQHMTMQVRLPASLNAGDCQTETDHASGLESAEGLPADLGRGHKQAHRDQLGLVESPDDFLQANGVG
jgi:hypothetical protein